ncbi:hypothetical protein [Paenibacillus sp. MMO-177]|uniref:hypothetical protein n=1 Tax=Paenibacillus sp. MMO-177 TaxID=3081289 RepID=UPI0030161882
MSEMDFQKWDGFLTIGSVREKLMDEGITIPTPTIRNWVNELQELKVHTIPRNARQERVFSKNDIEIIKFIYQAKKRFGNPNMDGIAAMIQEKFAGSLNYDPSEESGEEGVSFALMEQRLKESIRTEVEQLYALREEVKKELADLTNFKRNMEGNYEKQVQLLMPNPEEEKKARAVETRTAILNERSAERRVRQRLQQQAEDLWKQNPQKKGIIFKSEDMAAKIMFVQAYIDKRLEDEMKKEYES